MSKPKGIVASGHLETSRAAAEILRAGGNAYDAVLAALCAACVAEPLLVSLGGGGFLQAVPAEGDPVVFDFFSQTPKRKKSPGELDFYPIWADFGADRQEFHVGRGSMAVPGVVAGIFEVHRALGRLPLPEIMQPAISLARSGVRINALQRYIIGILEPILRANETVFGMFESPGKPGALIGEGELLRNADLAASFEHLLREGPELFYRREWAEQIAADCLEGGSLERQDLHSFRVMARKPLSFRLGENLCLINPPPSPGGGLIAFALGLLQGSLGSGASWGSREHLLSLVASMRAASLARDRHGLEQAASEQEMFELLGEESMARWQQGLADHSLFSRGTTHISVADADGNMASLTASNGEGSAYVIPGTGIMLNNMLGEEDLNPGGFHQWQTDRRLASMMSPVVAIGDDGSRLALGTGGSNRIRSAITQVLLNFGHFGLDIQQAVDAPRMHLEGCKLSAEPGFDPQLPSWLEQQYTDSAPDLHIWPSHNLFFGGVHAVLVHPGCQFDGVGDSRRGGVTEIA